jgi:hypothetical protein
VPWTELEDPERECKADEPAVDAKAEIELRWAKLRAAKRAKIASGAGGTSPDDTLRGDELDQVLGHEKHGITGWEHTRKERPVVTTTEKTNGKAKGLTKRQRELLDAAKVMEAEGKTPTAYGAAKHAGWGYPSSGPAVANGLIKLGLWPWRVPQKGEHVNAPVAKALRTPAGDGSSLPTPPAVDHEPEIEPEPPVRRFVMPNVEEIAVGIGELECQVVKLARALRSMPPDVRRAVLAFAVAWDEGL